MKSGEGAMHLYYAAQHIAEWVRQIQLSPSARRRRHARAHVRARIHIHIHIRINTMHGCQADLYTTKRVSKFGFPKHGSVSATSTDKYKRAKTKEILKCREIQIQMRANERFLPPVASRTALGARTGARTSSKAAHPHGVWSLCTRSSMAPEVRQASSKLDFAVIGWRNKQSKHTHNSS
eukprot:5454644-Amphidinium_carterae.1